MRMKCLICGREFESKRRNRVTCGSPECVAARKKQTYEEWARVHRPAYGRKRKEQKEEKKKKPKKRKTVAQIELEARKAHMSYGQYVARVSMK